MQSANSKMQSANNYMLIKTITDKIELRISN